MRTLTSVYGAGQQSVSISRKNPLGQENPISANLLQLKCFTGHVRVILYPLTPPGSPPGILSSFLARYSSGKCAAPWRAWTHVVKNLTFDALRFDPSLVLSFMTEPVHLLQLSLIPIVRARITQPRRAAWLVLDSAGRSFTQISESPR